MTFRVLFIDESDRVHKISCSKFDKFYFRGLAIPEFANQTIRKAIFYGESEDKQFTKLYKVEYSISKVDGEGKMDQDFAKANLSMLSKLVDMGMPKSEIELQRRKFIKKKHLDTFRWKPSEEEERRFKDMVCFT